jgi:hypothetical protein
VFVKPLFGATMSEELLLGYYVAIKEGASYLGGLLMTNSMGIPTDFRYTEPITPTKLQAVLYGKALEPHLKGEVIQKALLKEIKTPPDMIFVQTSDLAIDFAAEAHCAILSAQRTQEPPLQAQGASTRLSSREILVQAGDGRHPIKVIFPNGIGEAEQAATLEKIVRVGNQMDIVEPMERAHEALRALIQN